MATWSFATFADTSDFTKRIAQERKAAVRMMRRAEEFIVERAFPADLHGQIESVSKRFLGTGGSMAKRKAIGVLCMSYFMENEPQTADASATLNKPICQQLLIILVLEQGC